MEWLNPVARANGEALYAGVFKLAEKVRLIAKAGIKRDLGD